jgi:hypothetical protein
MPGVTFPWIDKRITEEIMATMELIDEVQAEDDVYELTPEEERIIDAAERRLNAGIALTGDEFRKKIDACLDRLEKLYG